MRLCHRSFANSESMVGRGLGKPLLPPARSVAQTTPLLPSQLQGWQRFSTEGMKWAGLKNPLLRTQKAESAAYMWLQRSSDHVKNFIKEEPITVFVVIGWMASLCYIAWISRAIHRNSLESSARAGKYRESSAENFPYFMLPAFRTMHVNAFGSGCYRKRKAKADGE
ncbi:hypothetical protein EJB05_11635, partial [Eragrostis curvula]